MADPATMKADLLAALRTSGDAFLRVLRSVPPADLERGRYEGGWNGRQILAHVAAIEWTYPRLLEVAAQARAGVPAGAEPPTRPAQGGMDAYNTRQVERRAASSVADLLDEFARNRAATIAAIQAADVALFDAPIRSAGGITGPFATVFEGVAVHHVLGHLRDITDHGSKA